MDSLSRWLLLSWLRSYLHAAHALGDAGDSRSAGAGLSAGCRIALIGGLISTVGRLLRSDGLLAVGLGLLVAGSGSSLGISGTVATVGGSLLNRRHAVGLGTGLDRGATGGGVGAGANIEGLGCISSLLLLAGGGCLLGTVLGRLSELIVIRLSSSLLIVRLALELAIAVVGRGRHDGVSSRWRGKGDAAAVGVDWDRLTGASCRTEGGRSAPRGFGRRC
jgi:hypothetical protein